MPIITTDSGNQISYQLQGSGPVVAIVNGAFSTAADSASLAEALVAQGFTALSYDRRARGGSDDPTFDPANPAAPVDPKHEVEDLAAVLGVAQRPVAVLGHSSGAVLALFAAASGVQIDQLFLSEPPFRFGQDDPAADLPERILRLIAAGKPDEAVTTFQLEGVGLPAGLVEQIRNSPIFPGLVALARSTAYDAALTLQVSTPTPDMLGVEIPTSVLLGVGTFPLLESAAHRLAEEMPAELVVVPESVGHRVDPEATARVISARWPN